MTVVDVPAVHELLKESPEASMWSRESLEEWACQEIAFVAELDGSIAGILVGRVAADECEILNLAVGTSWRRRGAATDLVRAVLELARSAGAKQVYLEVRASNHAAISFYESMGFRPCGRRSKYYRDPAEDAMLLVLRNPELKQ
jgi:ribosomal-protein-alanine N-acetyltransferase